MTTGEKKAPAKAVLQTAAPAVPAAKKRAVGQKVGERPEAFVALEPKLIGRMVATARQAAGLSQAELAARAEMAQPNIVRLEKGQALPSTTTLSRVAAATGNRLKIVFRRQTE